MLLPDREYLSNREEAVMGLVTQGLSDREIAERLTLSEHTIKQYVRRCLHVLKARNRTHAAVLYVQR